MHLRPPEFRREVQHPSALNLLDFPFLGAAFASRNAAEGGGEEGKIRSFLGEPERPKVLHFASKSTRRAQNATSLHKGGVNGYMNKRYSDIIALMLNGKTNFCVYAMRQNGFVYWAFPV